MGEVFETTWMVSRVHGMLGSILFTTLLIGTANGVTWARFRRDSTSLSDGDQSIRSQTEATGRRKSMRILTGFTDVSLPLPPIYEVPEWYNKVREEYLAANKSLTKFFAYLHNRRGVKYSDYKHYEKAVEQRKHYEKAAT